MVVEVGEGEGEGEGEGGRWWLEGWKEEGRMCEGYVEIWKIVELGEDIMVGRDDTDELRWDQEESRSVQETTCYDDDKMISTRTKSVISLMRL